MKRLKTDDVVLPSGSVVCWSRRFRNEQGCWRVPVRCGGCGDERPLAPKRIRYRQFDGICRLCARKHAGLFKFDDEILPSGSTVFWSRRQKDKAGRWFVPVRCARCGVERLIQAHCLYEPDFHGICQPCSNPGRNQPRPEGADQTLPNGSVVYWSQVAMQTGKGWQVPVRCGGQACGGVVRYVNIADARSKSFSGLCRTCAHFGRPVLTGRTRNYEGYLLVHLDPDHPYYGMANRIGYVFEHRLVMAQLLGRPLARGEVVHHINRVKDDNRIENLKLYRRRTDFYQAQTHHTGFIPVESREARIETLLGELAALCSSPDDGEAIIRQLREKLATLTR